MTVSVDREPALLAGVRTVAREVAAAHADDVDRAGRFPIETIEALREQRALSAFVPVELGGGGASLETVAAAARSSAASAAPPRWCSPCTRSRWHDRSTPGARQLV